MEKNVVATTGNNYIQITPAKESAACGIGFIATETGEASHDVVEKGLFILESMEHRGGVAANPDLLRLKEQYESLRSETPTEQLDQLDQKITEIDQKIQMAKNFAQTNYTTDGRGVMVEVDQDFFKSKYRRRGRSVVTDDPDRDIAIGVLFMPRDNKDQTGQDNNHHDACMDIINDELKKAGYYKEARLREPPIHDEVLGQAAESSHPRIYHLMIPQKELPENATDADKEAAKEQFDRDLYFLRKAIEKNVGQYFEKQGITPEGSEDFYIPSMSRKTIVFKGLSVANDLQNLYSDLQDPNYKSRFVIPHDRYSTNTSPAWRRAHPYRHIAHNGEINSLQTNINMVGRIERVFATLYPEDNVQDLFPIIQDGGTDSAMLDNVVEYLLHAGLSPAATKMLLVPEAFEGNQDLSEDVQDLYKFVDVLTQPWDGPNTMVIAGSSQIVVGGDRGGLRPNRFMRTEDGLVLNISEDMDIGSIVKEKRNLEPGEMVGIDLNTGEVLYADQLKEMVAAELEEKFQIKDFLKRIQKLDPQPVRDSDYEYSTPDRAQDLTLQQRLGNITQEHKEFLETMAKEGKEPRGSMGDDAAMAVVSPAYRTFDNLFQQSFAQVTNPAIDPIRESSIMSLKTYIGSPVNSDGQQNDRQVIELESPILSNSTFRELREAVGEANIVEIPCVFDIRGDENQMQFSLDRIKALATEAAKAGKQIVLNDENTSEHKAAIPMLLAAGAINTHLLSQGLRDQTSINVKTKQVSYSHGFAAMIGLGGANTVNAYMAEETIAAEHKYSTHRYEDKTSSYGALTPLGEFKQLFPITGFDHSDQQNAKLLDIILRDKSIQEFFDEHSERTLEELATHEGEGVQAKFHNIMGLLNVSVTDMFASQSVEVSINNNIKAAEASLLKTMAKKGIAHVASYRGGLMFEALGVSQEIIDQCFPGVETKLKGLSLAQLQEREVWHHKAQYAKSPDAPLQHTGRYKFRTGAGTEPHVLTTHAISIFQEAVREGDYEKYKQFRDIIAERSEQYRFAPRDWMGFVEREAIDVSEVEPAEEIVKRFFTGAMSFGSIGKEAHETLALAMNKLGGKSNSGEGGEDPERYDSDRRSKMKQVASGRFGVTLDYLIDADVIQIKIAQGAKPGEGGELHGKKVQGPVARIRGVKEGTTLISPPPHHDIYSIEDLEQLIYDLKQVNPNARVDVKLVSSSGVDIVADGVAKAYADAIHVGGSSGSTGASPQTSIVHAGMPWETSVNPVHTSLTGEHLRERVKLTTDGGMRTGRDLVIAALMGAEEYGFGLQALIAEGCLLVRTCQNGDCPVDIAKLNDPDNNNFNATPEMVENMMMFIAEDMRETLASLGLKSVDEAIGRADLLEQVWGQEELGLDISDILPGQRTILPRQKCELKEDERSDRFDPQRPDYITIDQTIISHEREVILGTIVSGSKYEWNSGINNQDRTVGGRLSHELRSQIINQFGRDYKVEEDTVKLNLTGIAGQSLGAFLMEGMTVNLEGGANDGVGKSLSGGKIVIRPRAEDVELVANPHLNNILGNAALYGATNGQLYAAGKAGNRFAIRMSNGEAVIDGAGSHACNYMTGGNVAILGDVGRNFAAGMSGGQVFVFDENDTLEDKTNAGSRHKVHRLEQEEDKSKLYGMITKHFNETDDQHAKDILDDWDNAVEKFKVVYGEEQKQEVHTQLETS